MPVRHRYARESWHGYRYTRSTAETPTERRERERFWASLGKRIRKGGR